MVLSEAVLLFGFGSYAWLVTTGLVGDLGNRGGGGHDGDGQRGRGIRSHEPEIGSDGVAR